MAESDADTLRRAAALMRKPGRSTFPEAFRLALADWLDKEADLGVGMNKLVVEFDDAGLTATAAFSSMPQALAVARAYLGEQP